MGLGKSTSSRCSRCFRFKPEQKKKKNLIEQLIT